MDVHIIISNPASREVVLGLARACVRAGIDWGVFLTNDGVKLLEDGEVVEVLACAPQIFACHESWKRIMNGAGCPVPAGSQVNNSRMAGMAGRIVSL